MFLVDRAIYNRGKGKDDEVYTVVGIVYPDKKGLLQEYRFRNKTIKQAIRRLRAEDEDAEELEENDSRVQIDYQEEFFMVNFLCKKGWCLISVHRSSDRSWITERVTNVGCYAFLLPRFFRTRSVSKIFNWMYK